MNPTPLERILVNLYRAGMAALELTLLGLFLYISSGSILLVMGLLQLPHPFLTFSKDPILLFLLSVGGLFVTVAMVGLIFYTLLSSRPEEDKLIIVLLGSIGIGLGVSTSYYSSSLLIQIIR